MNDDQLAAARRLIKEQRYAEARTLLQTLDDPRARRWLERLNEREESYSNRSDGLVAALVVAIFVLIIGGALALARALGWL